MHKKRTKKRGLKQAPRDWRVIGNTIISALRMVWGILTTKR